MPVEVAPTGTVPSPEAAGEGTRANRENSVRSKILSHFIKGRISLTPMEIVLMIPGELEHLESLVKLARKKKDVEVTNNQVSMVSATPTLRRICVNKTHRSKTLHLSVEMNGYVVEGLVDTGASMSVLAAAVVREMGMMHLVTGSENYKTASGVVTRALGRIDEIPVKVGGVQCAMTFMVMDTDNYDVLIGLDFLMKIGAVVDVERGLIQMRHSPGTNVEVLPLTMVNLLQRMNSKDLMQDTTAIWKNTHDNGDSDWISDQGRVIVTKEGDSSTSDSDVDTDDSEHCDLESNQLKQIDYDDEFGNTGMEELVKSEGPQEILQLILQEQVDNFMKEEITDVDDHADWIQWVYDAEQGKQVISTTPKHEEAPVLLQLQQMNSGLFPNSFREHLPLSDDCKADARWEEIFQKIRIDQSLDKEKGQHLRKTLERYQDVFVWNKRELSCCTIGEHSIDTQGYPPCRVSPGRLSYWEEAEVKRQIDVLVDLGKMKPSNSEYACRVTLPVKRDGSRRFCGDYRPLNLQTRRDSFPMPLVDDVTSQLGKSAWFTALDLQSGF